MPGEFNSPEFKAAYFKALRESENIPEPVPARMPKAPKPIVRRQSSALTERLSVEAVEDRESKTFVYFMKAGDRVKIGFSVNPRKRAEALQTGVAETIEILCTIPGGARVEKHFHARFKDERIGREWFSYSGTLREFLTGVAEPVWRL